MNRNRRLLKMKMEIQAHTSTYFTTRRMTTIALLGAVSIVMSLLPIGYIQVGIIRATFMHIPVIIAAIIEGPAAGAIVGLIFGITSLVSNMAGVMGPIFINPLVSVVPRVAIGLVAAYAYRALRKTKLAVPAAAALGTATNTIGVLGMIYLVAAPQFIKAKGISMAALGKLLLITASTNGVAEVIIAVFLVCAIVGGINRLRK
jgi:Predicted membrane protein